MALAAALVLFVGLALVASREKSGVFDELAHITAGFSYWRLDDFRLQPENGNWPQRIAALPLLAGSYAFPSVDQPLWRLSDVWWVGDQFFFNLGNNVGAMLLSARFAIALVGAALALLVFAWARELFGERGAWISLAIFVLSPTMLAHGALATSDMTAAAFFTASAWALWRVLHRASAGTVVASTLAVGGLFLSKFSAPIIVPVAGVMIIARLISPAPLVVEWRGESRELAGRAQQLGAFAAIGAAHLLVTVAMIWASYSFRFDAFAPGSPKGGQLLLAWDRLLQNPGVLARSVAWIHDARLLPEAWLYGFAHSMYFAEQRASFLNGATSMVGGIRGFFTYAALVKETIPALVLVAAGATAAVIGHGAEPWKRRVRAELYRLTPLLALVGVYWMFAITSNLNIGHRHLLPIIPAALVLAGATGRLLEQARPRRRAALVVVTALLAWHAVESFRVAPHYLAYFNQFAGGPKNGYRHLVDSSLDWGQDLPGLKEWLDTNNPSGADRAPVYLSYFGTSRPSYYKIESNRLPSFFDDWRTAPPTPLGAGIYAISASMLQGTFLYVPGPWTASYEDRYQATVRNLRRYDSTAANPASRAALVVKDGADFWRTNFFDFDQLRFARLSAFLRKREPDAQVGYSILIFRLSDADVRAALEGPTP